MFSKNKFPLLTASFPGRGTAAVQILIPSVPCLLLTDHRHRHGVSSPGCPSAVTPQEATARHCYRVRSKCHTATENKQPLEISPSGHPEKRRTPAGAEPRRTEAPALGGAGGRGEAMAPPAAPQPPAAAQAAAAAGGAPGRQRLQHPETLPPALLRRGAPAFLAIYSDLRLY